VEKTAARKLGKTVDAAVEKAAEAKQQVASGEQAATGEEAAAREKDQFQVLKSAMTNKPAFLRKITENCKDLHAGDQMAKCFATTERQLFCQLLGRTKPALAANHCSAADLAEAGALLAAPALANSLAQFEEGGGGRLPRSEGDADLAQAMTRDLERNYRKFAPKTISPKPAAFTPASLLELRLADLAEEASEVLSSATRTRSGGKGGKGRQCETSPEGCGKVNDEERLAQKLRDEACVAAECAKKSIRMCNSSESTACTGKVSRTGDCACMSDAFSNKAADCLTNTSPNSRVYAFSYTSSNRREMSDGCSNTCADDISDAVSTASCNSSASNTSANTHALTSGVAMPAES
jgi:hypothetical protein